ncbi:MAG: alpha/beta fold hydrolase [Bacteroidales bacterium]|jgi:pimeloyl-ACP methyl ester carboxylesterase
MSKQTLSLSVKTIAGFILFFLLLPLVLVAQDVAKDIQFTSTKDGTHQSALFYVPPGAAATEKSPCVPLLVFLHAWSDNYMSPAGNSLAEVIDESQRRGWILIAPNFRGPNDHPGACASDEAVQDVIDCVNYAKRNALVDEKRVYLLGSSGGGFMSLMMVTRAPQLWTAVSVWVPITDLVAWYKFSKATGPEWNNTYDKMMEACFGGPPDTPERIQEYLRRSPLPFLAQAKGIRIYIDSGIRDGHPRNAVPLSHSLLAFNALVRANGLADYALADTDVETITKEARIPNHLAAEREEDPLRIHKILFRRAAGPIHLTIFDGGHAFDARTGIRYFE